MQAGLPGAKVYKAFNTVGTSLMLQPDVLGQPISLMFAGAQQWRALLLCSVHWVGAGICCWMQFHPVNKSSLTACASRSAAHTHQQLPPSEVSCSAGKLSAIPVLGADPGLMCVPGWSASFFDLNLLPCVDPPGPLHHTFSP
jgi:hypothetical protein